MSNASQFSLANRKQLADMLGDKYEGLRYKAKHRYNAREDELERRLVSDLAVSKGALKIYDQINAAEDKIQELKTGLAGLGFRIQSNGDLGLNDDGDSMYGKTIKTAIRKEIGTRDDIDARFDSAQIAMMTVATLQDAEKLLKSLQE